MVVLAWRSEHEAMWHYGASPPESLSRQELIFEDSLQVRVAGIVKDWGVNTDLPFTEFISAAARSMPTTKGKRHMDDWENSTTNKPVDLAAIFYQTGERRHAGGVRNYWAISGRWLGALQSIRSRYCRSRWRISISIPIMAMTARGKPFAHAIYADGDRRLYPDPQDSEFYERLSTAQSIQRAREVAVRRVLGNGQSSIMLQFLTETFR